MEVEHVINRKIYWGRPSLPGGDKYKNMIDLVAKWQWILPSWVHEIILFYEENGDSYISCVCKRDYLRFDISIGDSFFLVDKDQQDKSMIHEFCHPDTTPDIVLFQKFLEIKLEEDDYKVAGNMLLHSAENATESLAKLLFNAFAETEGRRG